MAEHTPWGQVQDSETVARGIRFVSTAGHGGVVVAPTRMRTIEPSIAALAKSVCHVGRTGHGYFEEDCAWAVAALAFPSEFGGYWSRQGRDPVAMADHALATARNYHPDVYEAVTGTTVQPGESVVRDRERFEAQSADRFVVNSALGTGDGKVEVTATRRSDGATGRWRVDRDDYRAVPTGKFIIDEQVHERISA